MLHRASSCWMGLLMALQAACAVRTRSSVTVSLWGARAQRCTGRPCSCSCQDRAASQGDSQQCPSGAPGRAVTAVSPVLVRGTGWTDTRWQCSQEIAAFSSGIFPARGAAGARRGRAGALLQDWEAALASPDWLFLSRGLLLVNVCPIRDTQGREQKLQRKAALVRTLYTAPGPRAAQPLPWGCRGLCWQDSPAPWHHCKNTGWQLVGQLRVNPRTACAP